MKRFRDFEEDTTTASVAGAGDDSSTVVVKKKPKVTQRWSKKYKDSIDCSNPKGFSQKAHCAGKEK